MSATFKKWVLDFKPEIIYCQLSTIGFMNIILQTHKLCGAQIVIHFMDDWPSTMYKDKKMSLLLRAIMRGKLKTILSKSSLCLAISDAMAEEYSKRYNKEFLTFHNPVNTASHAVSQSRSDNKIKTIVYAGRIGRLNNESLIQFAKLIDNYDGRLMFQIYSSDSRDPAIIYMFIG